MATTLDRDVPDGTERGSSGIPRSGLAGRYVAGGTESRRSHPAIVGEQFARTESSVRPAARPSPVLTSVSDVDARLIKDSFAWLMADPSRAMEYFYARLFVQHPQIRALFPLTMSHTRAAVFEALARLIHGLDSPRASEQFLGQLARDHRKYGVTEKHHQPFFDALLATAEHFTGSGWTPQLHAAWCAALDHFAAVLRAAAVADAAANPAWWVGEIVQHDQRNATIAVITIRPDQQLDYVPGQYIAVQVPRWPRIWRCYSIANAPRDNGLIDLHVRAVPGGTLSTALVGHCGTGDTMVLGAPRGEMRVGPDLERDLVCVAGGTGLAPIKAMIESVVCATRYGRRRAIALYFGVKRQEDLYDMRDLETLRLGYPSLTLIPVAEHDLDFSGRVGGLAKIVSEHPSFRSTDVYLSGPEGMVREMVRVLHSRVPADCLHHDSLDALRAASHPARVADLSR